MPHIKKESDPLKGFRSLNPTDRRKSLQEAGLIVKEQNGLYSEPADRITDDLAGSVENAFGITPVPLCLATNFVVNGRRRPIVMATEERSVVAAASKAAKLCLPAGFRVETSEESLMVSQIMFSGLEDPDPILQKIDRVLPDTISSALHEVNRRAHRASIESHDVRLEGPGPGEEAMLMIDLYLRVGEAMGANIVTRIAESIADSLRPLTNVRRKAAICSNDRTGRSVTTVGRWPIAALGDGTVSDILALQRWADQDRRRAVTHNKGIMNAISAMALATGQDVRAVEAAAHAAASTDHGYRPLTSYRVAGLRLEGTLQVPIPVGVVGGATSGSRARSALSIMGVESARDLASLMGAAGLAQNFAALLSLVGEGIPESHLRLSR